jgi:predicted nucleic acid-binding protein
MNDAFLDASYAIALSAPSDQYHERAVLLANRLETEGTRLVTTRGVVLEIGNALSRQRYRKAAVALLLAIENDPNIDVVPLSEPLYQEALELYRHRLDKEWGLTDCLSFVVMQHRGLNDALTADDHFRQAGFRALLLEQ